MRPLAGLTCGASWLPVLLSFFAFALKPTHASGLPLAQPTGGIHGSTAYAAVPREATLCLVYA